MGFVYSNGSVYFAIERPFIDLGKKIQSLTPVGTMGVIGQWGRWVGKGPRETNGISGLGWWARENWG